MLQLFSIDKSEASIVAPNISLANETSLNAIDVGTKFDYESGKEDEDGNKSIPSDYNS